MDATDLFCGGGGSSTGLVAAGVSVRMASNHCPIAVETHNTNHPDTDHDIADIAEVDPARYPRTDLLWASPECKFWSVSRGDKRDFADTEQPGLFDLATDDDGDDELAANPATARERSRALMRDVPRFAAHHRYRAIIVENVPPILTWRHLPKWLARMRALGYAHQVLTLNSAFAHQLGDPAPTLRDRAYVAFWQDRYQRPDFDRWTRPQAWCGHCDQQVTALISPKNPARPYGSYGAQWVLRCPHRPCRREVRPLVRTAAAAIDLSLPGTRIGDRARPLVPTTMARLQAGLDRWGRDQLAALSTPGPYVDMARALGVEPGPRLPWALVHRNNTPRSGDGANLSTPISEPLRTLTTAGHQSLLWHPELLLSYDTGLTRPVHAMPLPTLTTVEGDALMTVEPRLEDCLYRMINPDEAKRGMGFPDNYVLLGTRADKNRLAGNAVTPPVARDLGAAVVEAITNPPERHRTVV